MTQLITSIALAALTFVAASPGSDEPATAERGTATPLRADARPSGRVAPAPLAGAPWTLTWDDSLDGALDDVGKRCNVSLHAIDSVVVGRFEGPVMGAERRAAFTGELIQGGALLLLQQREPGYVCSYQLSANGMGWAGTWRDSRGGSGTAKLARPAFHFDV